jgi:hypothetical protein
MVPPTKDANHVWTDDDIPHQITKTAKSFFITAACAVDAISCNRADGTGWQAAYVEVLRIELLADSVTEPWVREECPGRLLTEDCFSRTMRQTPKASGAVLNLARKRP